MMFLALAGCTTQPASIGGIVSTNPCADQLLLALAPPGRIAAISHYSQEEAATSIPLNVARRYRGVAGTAEEVIALKPDLVLASSFERPATLAAYKRLGLEVLVLDLPASIAASREQIRIVAAAVGGVPAGKRLIGRIDATVAATAPRGPARPAALLYIQGAFANGGPSLLGEMMARAGLHDISGDLGLAFSGTVPVESLIAHVPQLLLEPDPEGRSAILRRRVLGKAGHRVAEARFPRSLINCGGPTIIPAMQRLAAIRRGLAR